MMICLSGSVTKIKAQNSIDWGVKHLSDTLDIEMEKTSIGMIYFVIVSGSILKERRHGRNGI